MREGRPAGHGPGDQPRSRYNLGEGTPRVLSGKQASKEQTNCLLRVRVQGGAGGGGGGGGLKN